MYYRKLTSGDWKLIFYALGIDYPRHLPVRQSLGEGGWAG